MTKLFSRFIQADSIARAIEFGLLTALITVVSISAVTALGIKLSDTTTIVATSAK